MVTDYKTGKSDPYRGLDEGSKNWDPVQRGTRLQLPVYGLAALGGLADPDVPVRAQYWFVTGQQEFKTCGYPLDESVLSRFRDALGAITEGIGAGVFCDRPQPGQTDGAFSQYCDYCNADRLGTEDRRRKWERMQHRVELTGYRDLAEPDKGDSFTTRRSDDGERLNSPVPLKMKLTGPAITTDLGSTLFVEAGAGSGKTTALIERVVALLDSRCGHGEHRGHHLHREGRRRAEEPIASAAIPNRQPPRGP